MALKERARLEGLAFTEVMIFLFVLFGILMGSLKQGQHLLDSARTRRLQNDIRNLEIAVWLFYDRYGRFPGDCDQDGLIDALVAVTPDHINGVPESGFCLLLNRDNDLDRPYAELKTAHILSSSAYNKDLARNIFKGVFYLGKAGDGKGAYYNVIAVLDIPCFAAKAIDASEDISVDAGRGRIRELVDTGRFKTERDRYWSSCRSEEQRINIVYLIGRY